jgi:hypothetical protein
MDALIYLVVLLSASAAVVSLSYVWWCAVRDALRARQAAAEARCVKPYWPLLILALGWPGALIYWSAVDGSSHNIPSNGGMAFQPWMDSGAGRLPVS